MQISCETNTQLHGLLMGVHWTYIHKYMSTYVYNTNTYTYAYMQIGGKTNTQLHGLLMGVALAVALFGW